MLGTVLNGNSGYVTEHMEDATYTFLRILYQRDLEIFIIGGYNKT